MQDSSRTTHVQLDHLKAHWETWAWIGSPTFLTRLAGSLFGAKDATVTPASPPQSTAHSTQQHFTLAAPPGSRSLLTPGGVPPEVPVTVTYSLPSSATFTFDLGSGRAVSLDVHVRPTQYEACSVHYALRRNVGTFAGMDTLVRRVPPAAPAAALLAAPRGTCPRRFRNCVFRMASAAALRFPGCVSLQYRPRLAAHAHCSALDDGDLVAI